MRDGFSHPKDATKAGSSQIVYKANLQRVGAIINESIVVARALAR